MKPKTWIPALALIIGTFAQAATNDITSALQRGLFEEEANQNLNAAIQAYQDVISRFDKDRRLAATAIFRLGECYRKMGRTNDAAGQYERVLKEFADQGPLVTLSQQNLAGLSQKPSLTGTPAVALSESARQEQKKLLLEEIKLAEDHIANLQQRVSTGRLSSSDEGLQKAKRDVLSLKRQLVELESVPTATAGGATTGGMTSEEAEQVKRIQAIIKDSPDLINARSGSNNRTKLHDAAAGGQLVVARFLLENGAEVDAKDNGGNTALHIAAVAGHKAMVELLITHKADSRAADNNGNTPLHAAAGKGFRSVVEVLLAKGADPNAMNNGGTTPLHAAAAAAQKGIAELLIANKADVNAKGENGWTPLHSAASAGHPAVALLLIEHGAEVNAQLKNGETPLVQAVSGNKLPVVKLLLSRKADPNIRKGEGEFRYYPLHKAVWEGNSEIAEALLAAGANPDVQAQAPPNDALQDATPLLSAVKEKPELVDLLLKYKANPDIAAATGYTPLHLSVGQPLVMDRVLDAKPNVNAQDNNEDTPLHWAAGSGLTNAVEKLIANGAKVDIQDKKGLTALHFAVINNKQNAADLLLAAKADPNIPDNEKRTPLQIAKTGVGYAYTINPVRNVSLTLPGDTYSSAVPPGARPVLRAPSLPGFPGAMPSTPTDSAMVRTLKGHGAIEDLPRMDRIEVRRKTSLYSDDAFTKTSQLQDWNQFTLLEVIAEQYQFVGSDPAGGGRKKIYTSNQQSELGSKLPFPDLARIRIRRPSSPPLKWTEQTVDLTSIFANPESADCTNDVVLAWGDVVDIPESDHPVNVGWAGFSVKELEGFRKCLSREIQVVGKGQSKKITLEAPEFEKESVEIARRLASRDPQLMTRAPFWIKPVLRNSGMVLTSSDMSKVKVTRTLPGGEKKEYIIDCSEAQPAPGFWLRNGDVIEIPERK